MMIIIAIIVIMMMMLMIVVLEKNKFAFGFHLYAAGLFCFFLTFFFWLVCFPVFVLLRFSPKKVGD